MARRTKSKNKIIDVRHLEWCGEEHAFFALGHEDPAEFLREAQTVIDWELGDSVDDLEVTTDKVEHTWFRMMSPTEAKRQGFDYGYLQVRERPDKKGPGQPFPVTLLVL